MITNNEDELDIPDFLKISPERRKKAWEEWTAAHPPQTKSSLPPPKPEVKDEEYKARVRSRFAKVAILKRDRNAVKTGAMWDPIHAKWVDLNEQKARRKMQTLEGMTGPQLVDYYNEMARKVGAKEVGKKAFKNIKTAVARCQKMEEVVKAREAGVILKPPESGREIPEDTDSSAERVSPAEEATEATSETSSQQEVVKVRRRKKSTSTKAKSHAKTLRPNSLKQKLIELFLDDWYTLKQAAKKLYGSTEKVVALKMVKLGIDLAIKDGLLKARWLEPKESNGEKAFKLSRR